MDSKTLLEQHGERIRDLRGEGYGRMRIAGLLSEELGVEIRPHWVEQVFKWLKIYREPVPISEPNPPTEDAFDIEGWIAGRVKASQKKRLKFSRSVRTLTLPAQPIGIAVLGDPHVDNDGCDWALLYEHVQLLRETDGAVAACVGDMQDNWVGRLATLYSNSSTTASDGWHASRWLLDQLQWIALVGGNHDAWAHGPGVDPLGWLTRECGGQCYDTDELRITLEWAGRPDLEPIVWILRHDFGGRSWYHPTHGPHKEAMLDGRAHLLTAGHIHQWGELTTEQRHGRVTRALRVRGYKRSDEYAKAKGFFEQRHGAACFVVIDPCADEPSRLRVFWDLKVGCEYLGWLRKMRKKPEMG